MVMTQNRAEVTSADTKQLGFEYQHLCFIVELLKMRFGDAVGYETRDDIHVISAASGQKQYIQVKHTTEVSADNTPANLTTLSVDLWKTLSNWSKLIADPLEGRTSSKEQMDFIYDAKFVFMTNRNTCKNDISALIDRIKNKQCKPADVRTTLTTIKEETSSTTIKRYVDDVLKLGSRVLYLFLSKVEFVSSDDDIFGAIRQEIVNKMIADEDVDDVLGALYLQVKEDFFNKAKAKQHQMITYNEWRRKYQAVFKLTRTTLLPLRQYHPILPDHLDQQPFVKELIEIEAVDLEDGGLSELAEFTEHYLCVQMLLDDWREDGKIDAQTVERFHRDAKTLWKRIHRASHRSTKTDPTRDRINALDCFDTVMRERLRVMATDLEINLSNGEFILLANEEKIGWKYKWDK